MRSPVQSRSGRPGGQPPGWRGGRSWRQRQPRRPLRDRRWFRIAAVLLAVFLAWLGWSLGHALTNPGGGTFSERMAEWARDHYLGPLVTLGEWMTYNAPKKGGKPNFALTGPSRGTGGSGGGSGTGSGTSGHRTGSGQPRRGSAPHKIPAVFAAPRRLSSPAGRPLRGEGQWRVLYQVKGVPAIYGTYLRPDRVHTSYVSGIVSMNPRLLRFQLRPGVEDPGPGGYGGARADLAPGHRHGIAATFNGGFKLDSAGGGFYLNGTYRGALRKGAASMVYYRNGSLSIGVWGHHLRMNHSVAGVRQNLLPIVEHGRVPSTVDQNVQTSWGATLGGGYYVWRSGIGETRDGRIIFAYGPALDVRTLAELLRRAGCVEAMELDINPDWTNFMYYRPGHHPGSPTPVSLLPDQVQPAARYYALANRDFTAVFAR
jgi:hypothetical protein